MSYLWGNLKTMKEIEDVDISSVEEMNVGYLINLSRKGINYNSFIQVANRTTFTLNEWSIILHLSERTMQRYKKEEKSFDPMQSEKILEISLLINKGIAVFGSNENFNSWMDSKSIALGGIKPKELLDSSFGINMLKDELGRIEHGILA